MKKILAILCGILLTAGVAFAQKPYIGEWVIKSNGQLLYKIYDNGKNIRINYVLENTGEKSQYILFGKDSLCMLMPDAKGSESLLQLAGTLQRGLQASCKLREPCKGVGRLPAACRKLAKGSETLLQFAATLQTPRTASCKLRLTCKGVCK